MVAYISMTDTNTVNEASDIKASTVNQNSNTVSEASDIKDSKSAQDTDTVNESVESQPSGNSSQYLRK